ncbi:MAG: RuvA C-terminal domain-containing protein, partial [Proteobacteria bacterium]|nr:RuvA C-terminal domain-containing protein [Pseudomonadota bacterium]
EELFDDYESLLGDLRSALENLGYKEKEISPVVSAIRSKLGKENLLMDAGNGDKIKEEINFQFILKSALKAMRVQI